MVLGAAAWLFNTLESEPYGEGWCEVVSGLLGIHLDLSCKRKEATRIKNFP